MFLKYQDFLIQSEKYEEGRTKIKSSLFEIFLITWYYMSLG